MDTPSTSARAKPRTKTPRDAKNANHSRAVCFGSFRALSFVVKTILAVLAFAPLAACAVPTTESLYDYQEPAHDSGGPTPSLGAPSNQNGDQIEDASTTCMVQGGASLSSFAAKDAVEVFEPTKGTFTFLITDYADACSLAGDVHAGSNVIAIEYGDTHLASGTYDLASTAGLKVTSTTYDAACKPTTTETAASGTVKFDRLDQCGGVGSLDLVIGSDHVTATFTASVCTASGGSGACH